MSSERHPTEDLPAYALGALDEAERRELAAHIETCAQCQADLARFHEALYEAVAIGAVSVEPPRELRDRIVQRNREEGPARVGWTARLGQLLTRPVPVAVPAALAVLLVVAIALVGVTREQSDAYARALAGVADGRVVALAPTGVNPDARAAVVIPNQGRPYLIVRLPAPPSGKAWEAWVLRPGPVAVPAGTSDAGGVFTILLTAPLATGDGVAITLEPAMGSLQPTTQPVLAVGRT